MAAGYVLAEVATLPAPATPEIRNAIMTVYDPIASWYAAHSEA